MASEATKELVRRFADRTIEWPCVVSDLAFDDLSNNVDVDLPEVIIKLADGAIVPLDGACLSVQRQDKPMWHGIHPGDPVRIRATFLPSDSVFACCEIKRLKSGPVLILLGLQNAQMVGRLVD